MNWVNIEVVVRIIGVFVTTFLSLMWAKRSVPMHDEYYFTGSAFTAITFFFLLQKFKPDMLVLKPIQ